MSLSLLNAYNSSDDENSDNDEEKTENILKTDDSSTKKEENSKEGRNFFMGNSSDSENEEEEIGGGLDTEYHCASASNTPMIGPSRMPNPYDEVVGPVCGPPPHPSQMYNYAGYNQEYHETASSSSAADFVEEESSQDRPSKKRRRVGGLITDEDAKKLIKKYEVDSMNLTMPDELDIVDAHVDSHLGNVRENLVKNISTLPAGGGVDALLAAQGGDKKKKSKDGKPDPLAKRKNQITYLAHLAKANEDKLQNEWAKNRLTKRQTQAKYGF